MTPVLAAPWLDLDCGQPCRMLGWSLVAPGFSTSRRIVWREVRNADLPPDLDVTGWLFDELDRTGRAGSVAMLTSRDLATFETASATVDGITAHCVATVGLANAERVGARVDRTGKNWGTINIAAHLSQHLTDGALVEALTIAAQARTAAILDTGFELVTGMATGTGTDCIVIAAPPGPQPFAGLHTPAGEALGRAVYDAVFAGAGVWMEKTRRPEDIQ